MKPWQTAVRYCAIAFAAVLIFNIAFWCLRILGLGFTIASVGTYEEAKVYSFNSNGIEKLEIDIDGAKFTLDSQNGDKIIVKTNIKNLTAKDIGKTVKVKERQGLFTVTQTDAFVEIYYPVGFEFEDVDIDAGAGELKVFNLTAERLDADLGAGDTYFGDLVVTGKADIDGGVGSLRFSQAEITGLDLDLGVGRFSFHGILNGNNDISFGIGESYVDFYDDKERYYFDVEKGIGEIEYYGTEDLNFTRNGQETTVKIEGGIGKITVRFFDKTEAEGPPAAE